MKCAVVMSVYNGTKFLIEQLESIRLQTLQPDTVYITDDCSTDGSFDLIDNYIKQNSLKNWFLKKNVSNFGWKKSFFDLIENANEEIIFLADQDDIWNINKIETMMKDFNLNPGINVLASKYVCQNIIDKNVFENKIYDKVTKKEPFNAKIFYVKHLGCVCAFRKSFYEEIKNYRQDNIAHDAFLYFFSMITDSLFFNKNLFVIHRVHENNASYVKYRNMKEIPDFNLTIIENLSRFILTENVNNKKYKIKVMSRLKNFFELRKLFYESKNLFYFIKLFFYQDCYLHFRTYVADLIISFSK